MFYFYTSGFTTSGGFKFASTSTDSGKPSPFSIAPTTSASTTPPPGGGFKFGTPATTTSTGGFKLNTTVTSKEDSPKASPFTFGAQSAKKDSDKSETSTVPPSGGFKFGAPSTNNVKTTDSAAQQQQPTTGGFKFNVASSDSSSAANKPEVSPAPTTGGFKFGVQETGQAGKPASTGPVGGFSFGQKPESDSKTPPAGAATGSNTTTAPLSSGFTFGAGGSSTTTAPPPTTTTTGKSEADKPGAGGISFTAPAAAAKTEPKVEFKPGTHCRKALFTHDVCVCVNVNVTFSIEWMETQT